MSDAEWKPLIYTCDYDGDYMRWDGRIFPDNTQGYIFDVQLKNGTIHFGCLVQADEREATARAITQNCKIIELQHGDLLRPAVVDKKIVEKMQKAASDLHMAEKHARRIEELEYRKSQLTSELAKIDAELAEIDVELAKIKKEETE